MADRWKRRDQRFHRGEELVVSELAQEIFGVYTGLEQSAEDVGYLPAMGPGKRPPEFLEERIDRNYRAGAVTPGCEPHHGSNQTVKSVRAERTWAVME